MKKIVFVFCVSLLFTSKVIADCTYGVSNCLTWNPGVADNCGPGCTYTYDDENQTVYITTTGNNAAMRYGAFSPYAYDGNKIGVSIANIVVDGAIKISENAFTGLGRHVISGADGTLTLNKIEHHAFGDASTLSGNIVITESATFSSLAFYGVTLADRAKIYCAVENCKQKMIESCVSPSYPGYERGCMNAVNTIIASDNTFEQAPSGCKTISAAGCWDASGKVLGCSSAYLKKDNDCIASSLGCGANYQQTNTECNRLIYTIDEANRVAGEKNRVSITYR